MASMALSARALACTLSSARVGRSLQLEGQMHYHLPQPPRHQFSKTGMHDACMHARALKWAKAGVVHMRQQHVKTKRHNRAPQARHTCCDGACEADTHMLCVGSRMAQSQRRPHCRVVGQLRLPSGAEKSKHVIACMRERQCHTDCSTLCARALTQRRPPRNQTPAPSHKDTQNLSLAAHCDDVVDSDILQLVHECLRAATSPEPPTTPRARQIASRLACGGIFTLSPSRPPGWTYYAGRRGNSQRGTARAERAP
jgi:hypothetical protein